MQKIGISGYFGYQNFGDEIFLQTWKQIFNDHCVYALNQYMDIKSLDKIIIGGGDLLDSSLFTNAYWRPEFFEVPTYVYGVGVPNMPISRTELDKYAAFLHKCKRIYVRDEYAKNFIIEHGLAKKVEVTEDIAWSYNLPKYKYNRLNRKKKIVGISYRFNRNFDWINLCNIAKRVASDGFDILLIPLQPALDPNWRGRDDGVHYELFNMLTSNFKNIEINIIPTCATIDQRISFINECDFYITQRFHGMLMSLRVNTPCMTFGDSSKFIKVLERFKLEDSLCTNNYEKILKTYENLINEKYTIDQKLIAEIENKSNFHINNFKKIVLKGE